MEKLLLSKTDVYDSAGSGNLSQALVVNREYGEHMRGDFDEQVAGVAVLNDPVRRALYLYVAGSADAVGREEAATEVGVQRALAAFHMDKLVEEGLLDVEHRRL